MDRKKVVLKCLCGRVVTGVDRSHAKANLATHEKASNFHRDVMAAVKRLRGKRL